VCTERPTSCRVSDMMPIGKTGAHTHTFPYWIRHSPLARSGSFLRSSRRVTNSSDELDRISSTASTRSCRALVDTVDRNLSFTRGDERWTDAYYLISIKGLPTQLLSIRAPNFVLVRSRIHIKEPFTVFSVSFRYISLSMRELCGS